MTLQQLKYAVTAAECGTISAAAAKATRNGPHKSILVAVTVFLLTL